SHELSDGGGHVVKLPTSPQPTSPENSRSLSRTTMVPPRSPATRSRTDRLWRSMLDRHLDEQRGAVAGRAGHVERAAERFDAVAEPGQSGPLGGVGSADPVVADRQPHDRV